jgi:TolB protein
MWSRVGGRPRRLRPVLLMSIALAAILGAAPADAAFPGRNGMIAVGLGHGRCDEYGGQIATITPHGGRPKVRTRCGFRAPDWSADGRRLLTFGVTQLTLLSSAFDVPQLLPLPSSPMPDKPSFSPDGRYVAYTVVRDGLLEVWRAALSGAGDRRLAAGYMPRWSPDGSSIAYIDTRARNPGVGGELALMDARTGRWLGAITKGTGTIALDWAPDGRRIVHSQRDGPAPGTYVTRLDASLSRRLLTFRPGTWDNDVQWSPDGRRIAFVRAWQSRRSEQAGVAVWTIRPDGSRATRIYRSGRYDSEFGRPATISWRARPQ